MYGVCQDEIPAPVCHHRQLFIGNLPSRLMVATQPNDLERRQWTEEFDAAARRPLRQRFKYAFI